MSKLNVLELDRDKIPKGADKKKYLEVCDLAENDVFKPENTVIEVSNGNVIDISAGVHFLKNKISGLPDAEQKDILKRSTIRRSFFAQLIKKRSVALRHIQVEGKTDSPVSIYEHHRAEISDLFGRFFSIKEVIDIINKKYGIKMTEGTLSVLRMRNTDSIKEKQEAFKRDYSDVRLGYKRSRLDELTFLYQHRKDTYMATGSREDYKLLLQTIDQIKKEVEGDTLTINGDIAHTIEITLNKQTQEELMSDAIIMQLVIAKLAVRNNQNPMFFFSKLENSIYAKLNGFDQSKLNYKEEVLWPSQQIFGLDSIEQKAISVQFEDQELQKPVRSQSDNIKSELKNKLLEKIRLSKRDIDRIKVENEFTTIKEETEE